MPSSLTPLEPERRDLPDISRPELPGRLLQSAEEERGVDFGRVLLALGRFRWLIVVCTGLGLGGGIVATRYIPPEYQVRGTIWIQGELRDRQAAPIRGEQLLEPEAYVELLKSFAVLDPVVRELRLFLRLPGSTDTTLFAGLDLADRILPGEYEFTISDDGQRYTLSHRTRLVTHSGQIGDSVGRAMGILWVPQPNRSDFGRTFRFEILHPRDVSTELGSSIGTVLREQSFLSLRLTGRDPEATARTLNRVMERFVEEAALQKRRKLTMLRAVLDSQVTEQADRLKRAEEQFEAFRVGTVTLPREDVPVTPGLQLTQQTVFSQFFQMRTELDALRRDREALEAILAQAQGGALAVDPFHTIPAVRDAPDLQKVLSELSEAEAQLRALRMRYTDEHREVRAVLDRIHTLRSQTLPLYARALIEQLRSQEQTLAARINVASTELRQIPPRAQTESRLRREQEQADLLYRSLASSQQQARLAEASAIPDVGILDPAEAPSRPTRNTAPRIILIAFVAGLGLGLALAILLDHLDKRVRYPQQVQRDLGLPILGTIPQIRKEAAGDSPEEAAQVVEAFRSVRLSLTHSFPGGQPIALTISSPAPGDGKSLISANLALSFAEAGYRTLLLDGDIRRGDLHRTFALERRPGLLDYLSGEAELAAILRPGNHPRLMVIPCGTRRSHGPELLGSSRMQDLVAVLNARFEVVIVDTPPLSAGIDPFVLATLSGNLALILRAGETDRQLAEAKLQILDRLPVRLLGAILNDVRVGEGPYRYYAYTYGYVAGDEEGRVASLPTSP